MSLESVPPARAPRTEPLGRCPVCNATGSTLAFTGVDHLYAIPGNYDYRRCSACASVYQDPRVIPDDLALCYQSYFTHEPATARQKQRLLPVMMPKPGEKKAIDLGCGSGGLLTLLAEAGWDAEGVEWDPAAGETARKLTGRPVATGDFRTIDLPLAAWNLIVLIHVFEHLDDPRRALARIKELLAPGGRSVIIYPNVQAMGGRLYAKHWRGWEVPRHLVLASRKAVVKLAGEVGLVASHARSRAANASLNFAMSEAFADGSPQPLNAEKRLRHSLLGRVEKMAVGLGANLGEELVLVLTRPA